jgi:hypothetical protein
MTDPKQAMQAGLSDEQIDAVARELFCKGMCEPRNGRWHQFEKVDEPGKVWCEVLTADLHMLEETPLTSLAEFCAEGERLGVTAAGLAEALSKRPEFADCLPAAGVLGTVNDQQEGGA